MTWEDFEATCLVPAERVARAVLREMDRQPVGGVPETREIQRIVLANVAAFVRHWRLNPDKISSGISHPDEDIAAKFIEQLATERSRAEERGDIDPDKSVGWIQARDALLDAYGRLGFMQRAELRAACNAARCTGSKRHVKWLFFHVDRKPIGCVSRRRVSAEIRVCREDPEWSVDISGAMWVCSWAGGRGGLRCPLQSMHAIGRYEHVVCLDLGGLV